MTNFIKNFAADESGAVTVDWVVLTAAIVGLGLAVITSVRTGVGSLGTSISNSLSSASVASLGPSPSLSGGAAMEIS